MAASGLLGRILAVNLRMALRSKRDPAIIAVATVAGLLGVATLLLLLTTSYAAAGPTLSAMLLTAAYAGMGTFQLIAGIRWSVEHLYLSPDLELLLATPVPHRTLVAAKVIGIAAASPLSVVVVMTISVSFIAAAGQPSLLPLALVAPIVLATLMSGVAVLITMPAARLLTAARIHALVALLPIVLLIPILALSSLATGGRLAPGQMGFGSIEELAAAARGTLRWFPATWPAELLLAATEARWVDAGRIAIVVVAVSAGLMVSLSRAFTSTFYVTWGRLREDAGRKIRGAALDRIFAFLPTHLAAVVAKDLRLMRRDVKLMLPVVMPFFFSGYMFYVYSRTPAGPVPIVTWLPMSLFIPIMFGSLALQSFALEGKNIALLLSGPVRARDIVAAKLAGILLPSISLMTIAVVAFGTSVGLPAATIAGLWLLSWWTLGGIILQFLAIAALTTDFTRDAKSQNPLPGLLGILLGVVFMAGTVGTVGYAVALVVGGEELPGFSHPAVGALSFTVLAAMCAVIATLTRRAVTRIETLQV